MAKKTKMAQVTFDQRKKIPKRSPLAEVIIKNASLRATHYKTCKAFGINLDVVMPDNSIGFRKNLFARCVLGNVIVTPEDLNQKFGEQATEVAMLVNEFICDKEEKIELQDLKKSSIKKEKIVVEIIKDEWDENES